MVDNLFKGDLAVWEKELQEHYPELGLKRQPQDYSPFEKVSDNERPAT